ncbi:lamin tail domain-containing protein [Fodinibius sp. SL11]|uniref:lamin tail domain-containing protein n=1 Tax=Fodinibius sp. SL11 TaxID=3425690 RepID=UPI003F8816F4
MEYKTKLVFLFIGIFISITSSLFAQTIIIDESFSDGDYTNNPTWTDKESKHIVDASNTLQLDAPAVADEAVIGTTSSAAYGEWEALINMDFATSSTSLARFYIISDTESIKSNVNGYYIEVGNTPDEVSLYRQDGNNASKIIDGTDGLVGSSSVNVRIKATRNINGEWELFADPSGGTSFISQGTANDNTYSTNIFIGLFSKYIGSRSTGFEYDDIKVTKINPPLDIQEVTVVDNQTIEVSFNLDVDPASIQTSDFIISPNIGNPDNISTSGNLVQLIYNDPIPGGGYALTVNDIKDSEGNAIDSNIDFKFQFFDAYTDGDLVINEFAYDYPTTINEEYIEIKNTSNKYLNLADWQIADNNSSSSLGSDPIPIEPNSFLVISADTTVLYNLFGNRSYHQTTFPALNNTTPDAVQLITNAGAKVDSLTYNSNWGGTDVALERRSSSTSSIYQENWGDSPHPDGGTPGTANEIAPDNSPPKLTGLYILSAQNLQLVFGERLDQTGSYSITNNSISSVNQTAADTVELLLGSTLQDAQTYTLSIDNTKDIFDNTITPTDTSFTFYDPSPADSGDVVINEVMYAPPSTSSEYIELYNHSNKSIDIQNWILSDNREDFEATISSDQFIVPPDSFVVLTPDNTLLTNHPDISLVTMSGFPALNNGGDQIIIRDQNGSLLDSLQYSSGWGGDEVALERRAVNVSGTYQNNWANNPNGFGTPGSANEVATDTTPPKLQSLSIQQNQLTITFSEQPKQATAEDPSNYNLSNGVSIANAIFSSPDTVRLPLDNSLQNNTTYNLSIENITDIFGNTITPTDSSFTFYNPTPVDSGDVAINEFMSAPPSNSSEYIEIYNRSSKSLDLQGWTLSDTRQNQDLITNSQFIVPPDNFVVITQNNTLESNYPERATIIMGGFPSLNNGGDNITIRDSNGTLLDSLSYSSNWGNDEVALERRSIDVPAIYHNNWGDAPNGFGTPGSGNNIEADQTPPNLTNLNITSSNSIVIDFNELLQQQSLEDINNYQLSGSISIEQAVASGEQSVSIILASSLQNAVDYQLTINGIQDIFSNTLSNRDTTFTYYEISSADSGNVLISEYMSVPPSGSTEYVELRNATTKSFDLQHWTINDNTGNRQIITDQQFILPPDSAVIITPDQTLLTDFPDITLLTMGSSFPSLNNTSDNIVIRTGDGTRLDSLQYQNNWGTNEVALERRSFNLSSIYQSNWEEAPNGFGTPGSRNEVKPDTKPPTLENLVIRNNQELLLIFSEYLDADLAKDLNNFSLSGNLIISETLFSAPDSIFLSIDSTLKNASTYTLLIEGVSDLFKNSLPLTDTSFTYYEISPVDSGDVSINEFMYASPSGATEYIELYNDSNKSLDLQGWTLSDNREGFEATVSNDQFIVPPDSFVVLAPDSTIESEYPDIALITMHHFPALNNNGDQIIIRTQSGVLLDSLQYSSEWGGDEIALERRTTDVSGTYQSNWGNTPNKFGTPGSANEIGADQSPPDLVSLEILNASSIEVNFNEPILQQSLENPNNYQLSESLEISQASANGEHSVILTLASTMQNAVNYQFTTNSIHDIYGNILSNRDTSFTYFKISTADSGDVFISEFMSVPPSGSTEYVELRNTTTKSFDLQHWTINDNNSNRQTIADQQFILPPDSTIVIAPDHTLKSSFPDITFLTMGSSFPSLNNTGDDIVIRTADGTRLDTLRYNDAWGITNEVALERRSFDLSAIHRSNWGDAPNGFGTPGSQNKIEPNFDAPIVKEFEIRNSTELTVIFSEQLSRNTVENIHNYSLSSSHNIIDSQFSAPDTAFITLEDQLQNAITYTLTIKNIADLFGNIMTEVDTTFTYYEVSNPNSGDVFINEFNFVPPSRSTEYIEIYNKSEKSLDLRGWMLSDNRGIRATITNSRFIVPPDSFVVIAPDNTLLTNHPDISLVTMSGFPALNNGGDQIIIRDQNGNLLDSLQYSSGWGGDEVALERRTTQVAGIFSKNWEDAPNGFGTPGSQNEVLQDRMAPSFENLSSIGNNKIELFFSEKPTPSSATNKQNYQLSPSIEIQLISAQNKTVTLFLEQELVDGQTYEVTVSNISDIFGNTLMSANQEFKYLKIDTAQYGEIVINEILYDPGSSNKADFIELYNASDKNFDLTNWEIGDYSTETTIENPVQLKAGDFIVLTGNQNFATGISNGVAISGFPSLNNNTPDDIYIKNKNSKTIDSLRYYQSWSGKNDGSSLERKDPLAASNDASNWNMNSSNDGNSAGNQNISFLEDTAPPKIIFSKVLTEGTFEVRFNEFIRLSDELAFFYGDQQLSVSAFDSTNANFILLEASKTKNNTANSTKIRAKSLSDVKGNMTQNTEISVAQKMQRGDLVINEIMFNPLSDSDDNLPDQSEYIELRNTQDYAISLEGLYLHDEPDENGDIRDIQPISTTAKWVPSQSHVLIYADEATNFEESHTSTFFDLESPSMESIIQADRSSLSLASSDDAIYIADSTGATIDSVFYDESWHNPNIIDTRGISLERIAPSGPSDDDSNWGSSVTEKGGTPNSENSIYQKNAEINEETGISFEPNPFSPDGDGYEDNLFINYKLDQQDYLMKVRIYDRYGRLVRTLADGKKAGFEGQLIWDGRKDDNGRNRIGIYIVIFEAYDSASGSDRTFKKTVVLARKLN